jgi:hypothetical protein
MSIALITKTDNERLKMKVVLDSNASLFSIEGDLFEVQGEGEVYLFFRIEVALELFDPDSRKFSRFVLKGFAPYGRNAQNEVDRLIEKIEKAGVVDLQYWEELPERAVNGLGARELEEEWAQIALLEKEEARWE